MYRILTTLLLVFVFAFAAIAQEPPDWLLSPNLNTVLSIQHEEEMRKFYGQTLGLESLPDSHLPARIGRPFDTIMVRFRIGRSEIKMIPHEDVTRRPGGRDTAAGLRILSIPVTDGEKIAPRIEAHTGATVEWTAENGYKVGWVRDPDDNEIELRWYPENAPEEDRTRLELGITANDIQASAKHYGDWLGLPEISPAKLAGFPGETRRFKVGDSILRLWTTSNELPADTGYTKDGYGLRYVQFIGKEIYALHDALAEKGAVVAQEPVPLGTSVALFFLADPDGTINELVGPVTK